VLNLCIDIGNSFIKVGVFKNKTLLHKDVVKKIYVAQLNKLRSEYGFQSVIIGASGRIPKNLLRHLDKNYHLSILDGNTKLPIEIAYETPDTLGRDRVAAVIGARALYPEVDNCVIDIGTCITYDVVTNSGIYLGGNISPGVELRLKSMNDYTARLPLVERGNLNDLIGTSTKMALQNGATFGTLLEIESFITKVREMYENINITLTGGDANFFAEKINSQIFVNPNLVLVGLNEIILFNAN
jgi:type III pantothenate kinase